MYKLNYRSVIYGPHQKEENLNSLYSLFMEVEFVSNFKMTSGMDVERL